MPLPPVSSRFASPARLPAPGSTSAWPQSFPDSAIPKKRNVDRACDGCRRRKTRCDGPKMPDNVCTNCVQNRKICTYVLAQTFLEYASSLTVFLCSEASKPRGPPKAFVVLDCCTLPASSLHATYSYITSLENRVEKMEALLKRVRMLSWARTRYPWLAWVMWAHDPLFEKRRKAKTLFLPIHLPLKLFNLLFLLASHSSVQRLISLPNWAHLSRVAAGKMSPSQHQQGRRQCYDLFISFTLFQLSHL